MWPFEKTIPFETWPIVRNRPTTKTYGRSISLFINNFQCHLTTIDVYADGAIDAWGFLDFPLFKEKLRRRWVVPCPKDPGQIISVFNFGMTGFRRGEWFQTPERIVAEVETIVCSLNPDMTGLIDMEGSDTRVEGKVRYSKMGLSDKKPYRRDSSPTVDILAKPFPVLRVADDYFVLTQIFLFSDSQFRIGADGHSFPLDQMQAKFDSGEILCSAEAGSRILIPGLGFFDATTQFGDVKAEDRMLELSDALVVLNGQRSSIELCRLAYRDYQATPSSEKKEILRRCYERVPTHMRCYCGDMDYKDYPIRKILRGDSDTAQGI